MVTIYIVIIVVSVMFSAIFSATETAFSTSNKARLIIKAEDGNRKAKLVLKLIDKYDKLITTILIGNNIVNILASSIATVLFCLASPDFGATISTVVMTITVLIFGEITPKALAKEYPETFACFIAPFVQFLMFIFTPFNWLFSLWKKAVSSLFKKEEEATVTDEELLVMVDEAEQEGGINADERELIKSAIEFNDLEVKDILVPRIDVEAIDIETPVHEIREQFAETGYSRLPVYMETIDKIIGILHEKDLFRIEDDKEVDIKNLIKPAIYVVANSKISFVLRELQKNKMHMAIVSGEFGETVGIITMEDILEELVGEIFDEHDEEELADITPVSDNEYRVLGSCSLSDFNDAFNMDVEVDSSTVGGWVIELLGKVPCDGDTVAYENVLFTVVKTEERRIVELKLIVNILDDDEE